MQRSALMSHTSKTVEKSTLKVASGFSQMRSKSTTKSSAGIIFQLSVCHPLITVFVGIPVGSVPK